MKADGGRERRAGFSVREVRALLFLLPFLAALSWIVYAVSRGGGDPAAEYYADAAADTAPSARNAEPPPEAQPHPFVFDPNTVTYEELRKLGFDKRTAAGIVKYRIKGKVFEIPEDFAVCYGVTDSAYARLKPYIIIGEAYRARPSEKARPAVYPGREVSRLDTFNPNRLDAGGFRRLGFSVRQAEAIIKYRTLRDSFRSADELAECYVVSPEMFEKLRPYIAIPSPESGPQFVELNTADSAALVSVIGIGPRSASDILAYREKLGGYYSAGQLAELKVITERNFEMICKQIRVDSCKIRKIDINFALPESLARHPYMTPKRLRRILKNRQLKGGWTTIGEMLEDNTLTPDEAARLSPYLMFGDARKAEADGPIIR